MGGSFCAVAAGVAAAKIASAQSAREHRVSGKGAHLMQEKAPSQSSSFIFQHRTWRKPRKAKSACVPRVVSGPSKRENSTAPSARSIKNSSRIWPSASRPVGRSRFPPASADIRFAMGLTCGRGLHSRGSGEEPARCVLSIEYRRQGGRWADGGERRGNRQIENAGPKAGRFLNRGIIRAY